MSRKMTFVIAAIAVAAFMLAVAVGVSIGLAVGLTRDSESGNSNVITPVIDNSNSWNSYSTVLSAAGGGINRLTSVGIVGNRVFGIGLYNGYVNWTGVSVSAPRPWATYIVRVTIHGTISWLQSIDTNALSGSPQRIAVNGDSLYVAGSFQGNVSFGGFWLNAPNSGAFVAKLSSAGTWLWAVKIDGNRVAALGDMKAVNDTVYVAVNTRALALTCGSTTLQLAGSVLRPTVWALDGNGAVLSAVAAGNGTTVDDRANAIAYSNGTIYIAGGFRGTARFGATLLSANTVDDLFIAATNGVDWLWAVSGSNNNIDFWANGLAVRDGYLYAAGLYGGNATFGPYTLVSKGGRDLFVCKLDTSGNWIWAVGVGDMLNDYASSITSGVGGLYVAGSVRGNVTFGSDVYDTYNNTEQVYLANIDADGMWRLTLTTAPKTLGAQTEATCVASLGNRYATGGFYGGSMEFGNKVLPYSELTTSFLVISLDTYCKYV